MNYPFILKTAALLILGWLLFGKFMTYLQDMGISANFAVVIAAIIYALILYVGGKAGVLAI